MDSKEVSGCFLMSGVRILHFLQDWWKCIQIHQILYMYYMYGLNFAIKENWRKKKISEHYCLLGSPLFLDFFLLQRMLLTVCYHNWSVSWYRFAAVNMMIRTMAIPSSKQQVVSCVISWNNFLYYDNVVWEYHWLFVIDHVSSPDVVLRHVSHEIIKFHCVVSSMILNGIHCPRTTLDTKVKSRRNFLKVTKIY